MRAARRPLYTRLSVAVVVPEGWKSPQPNSAAASAPPTATARAGGVGTARPRRRRRRRTAVSARAHDRGVQQRDEQRGAELDRASCTACRARSPRRRRRRARAPPQSRRRRPRRSTRRSPERAAKHSPAPCEHEPRRRREQEGGRPPGSDADGRERRAARAERCSSNARARGAGNGSSATEPRTAQQRRPCCAILRGPPGVAPLFAGDVVSARLEFLRKDGRAVEDGAAPRARSDASASFCRAWSEL